jgi:hypothetical protein
MRSSYRRTQSHYKQFIIDAPLWIGQRISIFLYEYVIPSGQRSPNALADEKWSLTAGMGSMGVPSRRRARRGSESGGEGEDPTQRKVLPTRSSRGTRINKLLGEEAEADEAFWGQDAWREDASDDDYSTEEGAAAIWGGGER